MLPAEMRHVRPVLSALCAIVAVGTVIGAWFQGRPMLAAPDARDVAARALAAAGVSGVRVLDDVSEGTFTSATGGERRAVWVTRAVVDGGTVQLSIDQQRGRVLRIDDTNGPAYLLTDAQVKALEGEHDYGSLDLRTRRNYYATAAGLLGACTAVALVLTPNLRRSA